MRQTATAVFCEKIIRDHPDHICARPATHAYHGLGGVTRFCQAHAEAHAQRWGSTSLRELASK